MSNDTSLKSDYFDTISCDELTLIWFKSSSSKSK